MTLKQLLPALAAGTALISGGAMAGDGSLGVGAGATSTGSTQVQLVVPDLIQISNIGEARMDLNHSTANGRYEVTDGVCVYRNGSTGNYSVTATSANGGAGTFAMLGAGTGDTLAYSVSWNNTALTESANNNNGGAFFTGNTTQVKCGGATNSTLLLTATEADVGAAAQDTYDDVLSVTVTAE